MNAQPAGLARMAPHSSLWSRRERTLLGALSLVVFCVHIGLLGGITPTLDLDTRLAGRPLVIRSIEIRPPTPVAASAPAATKAPAPPAAEAAPTLAAQDARTVAAPTQAAPVTPPSSAREEPASTPATPALAPAVAPSPDTPQPPSDTPPGPATARPDAGVDGTHATAALAVPGSTAILYDVRGSARGLNYSANGVLNWRTDGSQYEASMEVSAFLMGSRVQTSSGRIGPEGVLPQRFASKGSRSEEATHFDRDKGRIVFSRNNPPAALMPGAQDQLSVLFQIAAMLAADPQRYRPGSRITIQTASLGEAADWVFDVEAEQPVAVDGGSVPALKLTRAPRREFDTRLEIWLTPQLGWLPARVRITQANGDFADQVLRNLPSAQ